MRTKWKATVLNPLGQETYDMVIEKIDEILTATVSNEKGTVVLKDLNIPPYKPIYVADIETPMKTRIQLDIESYDPLGMGDVYGVLKIGDFAIMKVDLVRYE